MALIFSPVVAVTSEKEGSPVEQWTDQGIQATCTLLVPWADRYALVTDLLENARVYPHLSTIPLHAVAAGINPHSTRTQVASGDQANTYETAEVVVNYGTLEVITPGGGGGIQIFAEELNPNGEFLTLEHSFFRWGSAAGEVLKKEEAPGKLILSIDFVQTQYQMPSLHTDLIDLTNCTNASPITASMLGYTFDTDTLLYAGSSPARTISTVGAPKWTVAKRFCFRRTGWNRFWRANTQTYEEIWIGGAGGTRYYNFPPADFGTILV